MNPWAFAAVVLVITHHDEGGGLLSGIVFPPGQSSLVAIAAPHSATSESVAENRKYREFEIAVDEYAAQLIRGPRADLAPGVILNALPDQDPKISEGATIWAGASQLESQAIDVAAVNEVLQRRLRESKQQLQALNEQHRPFVIRNYVCDAGGPQYERILHAQVNVVPASPK